MGNKNIIISTVISSICAFLVWILIDYFIEGQILIIKNLLQAAIFALFFGLTFKFVLDKKRKKRES